MSVFVVAHFTPITGYEGEFWRIARELRELAKTEEGVLGYEWHSGGKDGTAVAVECFVDSVAMLHHSRLAKGLLERLDTNARMDSMSLFGDVSQELRSAIDGMSKNIRIHPISDLGGTSALSVLDEQPPTQGSAASVQRVEQFWDQVWNAHDPQAADRFIPEDFVIINAGVPIEGRENFKEWIGGLIETIPDLHLDVIESFQNADGSRVASRWVVHGHNNGVLGTEPDGRPISFSGTAVWEISPEGELICNHVERSTWELHQELTGDRNRI